MRFSVGNRPRRNSLSPKSTAAVTELPGKYLLDNLEKCPLFNQ
jgi:hypothetical protein